MSQPAPIKPLKVLLPADLQKRLQDSVKRRLGRFKLEPQFDLYPPRKSAPNDGTIKVALPHRLSGGLRKINTLSKFLELYLVRGPSLWHRVRFTDEKSDDPRRERYQQLQQDIGQREKSKEFLRVVHQKLVLEEKEFYLKEEQEIVKRKLHESKDSKWQSEMETHVQALFALFQQRHSDDSGAKLSETVNQALRVVTGTDSSSGSGSISVLAAASSSFCAATSS